MSNYTVKIEKSGVMFCTWLATIEDDKVRIYTFGFSKNGAIRAANRQIKKWEREKSWQANAETFIVKGENK